jgi:hypothetical protein
MCACDLEAGVGLALELSLRRASPFNNDEAQEKEGRSHPTVASRSQSSTRPSRSQRIRVFVAAPGLNLSFYGLTYQTDDNEFFVLKYLP